MADTTSASLLLRVRDPRDQAGWRIFHAVYAPLILRYARARGLSEADADEVLQECMSTLTRALRAFEYSPEKGSFKGWLRTIVSHEVSRLFRKRRAVQADTHLFQMTPDDDPSVGAVWDKTYRLQVLKHCLETLKEETPPKAFAIFQHYVLDEWPVERVQTEIGVTANEVYLAKSRLTRRLREKMQELFGEEV